MYRPSNFTLLPTVIKNLLIINGLFFLGTVSLGSTFGFDLFKTFSLFLPGSENFRPHQLFTHMFMHANFGHIFFNMFALWMFGTSLENAWGPKRFLTYYLITGLGAAFLHLGVQYFEARVLWNELINMGYSEQNLKHLIKYGQYNTSQMIGGEAAKSSLEMLWAKYNTPTVGASGAVFGVLLAFGMMFPNQYIYLYFLFPIKAKYFVMAFGALELINGLANDPSSNIAHFAHLGGMLFGFLLIKYWQRNSRNYYG